MYRSDDEIELQRLQVELQQRQRTPRTPPKMASAINDLLARRGYAQQQTKSRCDQAWRQAAGAVLAGKSRAGHVRGGVLEVTVDSSAAIQELTFIKKKLIQRLAELAPDYRIRDLRFRMGAIS